MMIILRIIVAIIIFGHGIGHIVGFLGAWTNLQLFPEPPFNEAPWIFPGNILIQSPIGKVFGIFWLLSTVAFFAAAIGLAFNLSWWVSLAVLASILSMLAVIPWWNSFTPGIMSKNSAVVVNLIVLLALLGPWKDGLLARLSSG